MRGEAAFNLVTKLGIKTVLDYGCGINTPHQIPFISKGISWYGFDIVGNHFDKNWSSVDCVWVCHVLEHIYNPLSFLHKMFRRMKTGAYLAVTVPPMKHEIVGGHINMYNAGLLLYQLVLAGWDCSKARVKSEGYDVSVIVQRQDYSLVYGEQLKHDEGDIELIARYLPAGCKEQGFNGDIKELNWE